MREYLFCSILVVVVDGSVHTYMCAGLVDTTSVPTRFSRLLTKFSIKLLDYMFDRTIEHIYFLARVCGRCRTSMSGKMGRPLLSIKIDEWEFSNSHSNIFACQNGVRELAFMNACSVAG